jgi:site-specific recombinase XerD
MLDSLGAATPNPSISELTERYCRWGEAEQQCSPQTTVKRRDCLRQVVRVLGDLPVLDLSAGAILDLKADLVRRGLSPNRQYSILAGLKYALHYARDVEHLAVLDPQSITFPKRPRKHVVYLTPDEVERFIGTIKIQNWHRPCGPNWLGLRFRALVETILGSGLRIGEVLSLSRDQLDPVTHEVRIVGKGRKERIAFITDRAFYWINEYLSVRTDNHRALFVTLDCKRALPRTDVWRSFDRHRKLAGITKKLTPHILRHTAATQLLFNGCPIGHIKEILGHSRLETTCRYYLGLDQRAAKAAHLKYLFYRSDPEDSNGLNDRASTP